MICCHCEESIIDGERFEYRHIRDGSGMAAKPIHHECAARLVLGSLGHLQGKCSCFNRGSESEDDPPGLTKRQAAKAAFDFARGRMPS